MALVTWDVRLDLDKSGGFATDITQYLFRQPNLQRQGLGRQRELDAAGEVGLTVAVRNDDGRFSPKNSGGAYFDNLHPAVPIRVRATWNAVTYDYFRGLVTGISVKPKGEEALAYLTCADLMWVLARTDTRLPLMEAQRTGIIIQRLLDYAEDGEHVDNPRFKDDLTGYAAVGGASPPVRVTTGLLLHSPAAMDVTVSNASGSGWRYTATSETTAGQKVKEVAYVWAEDPAAVGKTVVLRVVDNGGVRATSAAVTLQQYTQRLEVEGTFDGASSARYLEVVTNSAQGAFTFRSGALHGVPAGRAFDRAVDNGVASIERLTYNRTPALAAIQEVRDNELGGLFYVDQAGKTVFEARDHRWQSDHLTSQTTVDETFKEMNYSEDLGDRVSEVVLDFPRWEVGDANSIVFSLFPVPRAIGPNGTLTIEAPYDGALVRDTIVPVAGTDYKFNSQPGGGGVDETANVSKSFEDFGGGSVMTFTNNVARTLYLTIYQVRGTAVREASDRTPVRVTPASGPGFLNVLSYGYRLQSSESHIRAWAEYLAPRHGDSQQPRVEMTVAEPFPDAPTSGLMAAILGRKVSDRVTVRNDDLAWGTKVNGDFYIDGIDLEVGDREIAATWRLTPVDVSMMIWDTSSWDGADVWAP